MKKYFFTLLGLVGVLAGCGDGRIRELRSSFVDVCYSGGLKKEICKCIFSKYEENYTGDQLLDMKVGVLPAGFSEFSSKATMQCVRDN